MEVTMEEVSIDKIVAAYIKIRDAKESAYRKYKEEADEYEAQMDVLKYKLIEVSKETGVTSFSTKYGTAYRTTKQRYWTSDWESFHKFLLENNAPELLERRIQQTHMKEFLEEHPDLHPPGLNVDSEYEITVRRR
jgi:hypothetical protein